MVRYRINTVPLCLQLWAGYFLVFAAYVAWVWWDWDSPKTGILWHFSQNCTNVYANSERKEIVIGKYMTTQFPAQTETRNALMKSTAL